MLVLIQWVPRDVETKCIFLLRKARKIAPRRNYGKRCRKFFLRGFRLLATTSSLSLLRPTASSLITASSPPPASLQVDIAGLTSREEPLTSERLNLYRDGTVQPLAFEKTFSTSPGTPARKALLGSLATEATEGQAARVNVLFRL